MAGTWVASSSALVTTSSGQLLALFHARDAAPARLDELSEFAPAEGEQHELVFWFSELVRWLRPLKNQRGAAKLKFFDHFLAQHPDYRERVSATLSRLVKETDFEKLLAYGGIASGFHFAGAVKEWFIARILPAACETHDATEIAALSFIDRDLRWISRAETVSVLSTLLDEEAKAKLERSLVEALADLAHQIVAQAHAPSVRSLAQAERSPFRGLYEAVSALRLHGVDVQALRQVVGRSRQCIALVEAHRAELVVRGADLNTTFQLLRTEQQLQRLILLAELRHDLSHPTIASSASSLVASVLRHRSGARLFRRSSDLLTQNLVDTAAHVGRAYLSEERSSWRAAFMAGAGGGALMVVATLIKYGIMSLHAPPLNEGLAFSLNYGAAFCAAYLLHFTIATKLPAHTAALLARSVQGEQGYRQRLTAFGAAWRAAVRLQIAGLLGNVAVAAPLAVVLDQIALRTLGRHLIGEESAAHALHANSLLGPSILFAALTGVFLWVSSLLGATAENWTRIHRLIERLATNRWVKRAIGTVRARPIAETVVGKFGGLFGNFSLGLMLGGIPALCGALGLPIEIRHVTVSTSSVALAISGRVGTSSEVALAIAGVVMIGLVNVCVSFGFALWLALRATGTSRRGVASGALVWLGLKRWLRPRTTPARDRGRLAVAV